MKTLFGLTIMTLFGLLLAGPSGQSLSAEDNAKKLESPEAFIWRYECDRQFLEQSDSYPSVPRGDLVVALDLGDPKIQVLGYRILKGTQIQCDGEGSFGRTFDASRYDKDEWEEYDLYRTEGHDFSEEDRGSYALFELGHTGIKRSAEKISVKGSVQLKLQKNSATQTIKNANEKKVGETIFQDAKKKLTIKLKSRSDKAIELAVNGDVLNLRLLDESGEEIGRDNNPVFAGGADCYLVNVVDGKKLAFSVAFEMKQEAYTKTFAFQTDAFQLP